MSQRVVLVTLLLNERHWLNRLFAQHINFPGISGWVFVEGVDRAFAEANPASYTKDGLSVDGTTKWLKRYAGSFVQHIQLGFFGDGGPQGKCEARQVCLDAAAAFSPDWIYQIDADEAMSISHQKQLCKMLENMQEPRGPALLKMRHPWRPASIENSSGLLDLEVVNGYAAVPHLRIFPWYDGLTYVDNHNCPRLSDGSDLRQRMVRYDSNPDAPEIVHFAFASPLDSRRAKAKYYVHRGEGKNDGRQKYVDFRNAFETWQPGDILPGGASVIPYSGPKPEAYV